MTQVKRLKVSFIDKDTMCAVDPNLVYLETDDNGTLIAFSQIWKDETFIGYKEVEIKIF